MNKKEIKELGIVSIVLGLMLLSSLFMLQGGITGWVIVNIGNYTDNLDIDFTTNSSYVWSPDENGVIDFVNIKGYIEGDYGSVSLLDNIIYGSSGISPTALVIGNSSGEIDLEFSYGDYKGYDSNNDGVVYVSEVIDFSIKGSFDFDYNESYLCTKHIVENLDLNVSSGICYGGHECCSFLGLGSIGFDWNESFYLNKGKYSSGYNNTLSSTIVYYDVSLDIEDLHSYIYNSETLQLPANFVERVYFNSTLKDLNLDYGPYNLSVIVDGLLHLSNISYSLVNESGESLDVSTDSIISNNWTIEINSRGVSDLIISNLDGNYGLNNSLELISLFCDGVDLLLNASFVLRDDSEVSYNESINLTVKSIILEDYSCAQAYFSINVNDNSIYTQKFWFSDIYRYVNNSVVMSFGDVGILAAPGEGSSLVNFTSPTPANGSSQTETSVEINVSVIEANLSSLIYNWNGTNYTIYNDSLVLMYNFDEYTGLNDTSKYGNNCSCTNCPTYSPLGKYNAAYEFDGVNDYIQTSNIATSNQENWTLSVWAKKNSVPTGTEIASIILLNGNDDSNGYSIGVKTTDEITILYSTIAWKDSSYIMPNNTWTHIVATNDNGNLYLYINGILEQNLGSGSTPNKPTTGVTIGTQLNGPGPRYFNGSIDEVRIWNRSLNSDEIYQQYVSNLNKYNSTQWYLYVNQSKNSTNGLNYGDYTYQTFTTDTDENLNSTEERILTINSGTLLGIGIDMISPTSTTNVTQNVTFNVVVNVSCTGDLSCGEVNVTLDSENTYIFDNFDTGEFGGDYWTTYRSDETNGRIAVNETVSYSGGYSVIADSSISNLNELITNYEFTGVKYIYLDFYWIEAPNGDELDTGGDHSSYANKQGIGDAVYFTCDSTSWYLLQNAPNSFTSWTNQQINVTADPDFCGTLNSSFKIKFTQYGTTSWPDDGIAWDDIRITMTYGNGGIISINSSDTPFYTNVSNPVSIALDSNESKIVTFKVNATGEIDETFSLFAYANRTALMTDSNRTANYSVTIKEPDTTYPLWFNNKTNLTGLTSINSSVYFNITINESNPDSYIFSFYNGSVWINDSAQNYSDGQEIEIIKNITSGVINWIWYINDTFGNTNQTTEWNVVLDSALKVDVIYPTVNINVTQNLFFNVTVNVSCTGSIDCGSVNVSLDPAVGTVYNFTSCGQSGRLGPSQGQCDTNYSGTSLEGIVTINTTGYQEFVVPSTGTYLISAYGGSGGIQPQNIPTSYGALISGNVSLTAGTKLIMVVGQRGVDSAIVDNEAGAGGGTFVTQGDNYSISIPLIVAGGAGGAGSDTNGGNAYTTINGIGSGCTFGGSCGATNDGAGFYFSAGQAQSFRLGENGGIAPSGSPSYGNGGFGSGGGGTNEDGSGGGGFTGGIGADSALATRGGASYINDSLVTLAQNTLTSYDGHGQVTIELLTVSSKTGLISTNTSETPFYTNKSSNPYNISLVSGESEVITFYVNATGSADITHEFFVYANRTDKLSNNNISNKWNVTILPIAAPTWSNNKTNLTSLTTLGSNVYFNITLNDHSPDSYIFRFYNGSDWVNDSAQSFTSGQEIEVVKNITSSPINWTWYINDSEGNINQTTVWEMILNSSISIVVLYPDDNMNVTQNELFNVTVNVTCTSTMPCRGINVTLDPEVTYKSCKEILEAGLSTGDGVYTIRTNNTDVSAYCDMTTSGGGWTLFANMGPNACAEGLTMGYNNLTNLTTIYLPKTYGENNHTKWLLTHHDAGSLTHTIFFNFTSKKTLRQRFADMVSTGVSESLNWTAYNASNSTSSGSIDNYMFSNEAGITTSNWYTRSSLSSDDGSWGVADVYEIDGGSGGPSISTASNPRYGFENSNTGDSSCNTYFTGYKSASSSDWIAHVYFRENDTTTATAKGGTVLTNTSATPFYTNKSSNPYNISLLGGESEVITFYVNATGDGEVTHEFFVYANQTSKMSNSNRTGIWNVTIKDYTIPTIDYEAVTMDNGTYSQSNIEVNVTATDTHLSTIVNYVYNSTGSLTTSASGSTSPHYTNFTSLADDIYYINSTATDTATNSNSTSTRRITLDTTGPQFSYLSLTPTNDTRQPTPYFEINVSMIESDLEELKYEWNGTNYTYYNDSLVLMMNFDNISSLGDNSTYVVDMSQHKNNGTIQNGERDEINLTGAAKYGVGGLNLDGTNDYVSFGTVGISGDMSRTISGWVKNNDVTQTAWTNIFGFAGDGSVTEESYFDIEIQGTSGLGTACSGAGGYALHIYGAEWCINNDKDELWHHIAATYNGATLKAYYDGVEVINTAHTTVVLADNFRIGKRSEGSEYFDGLVDEVRVWNKSLSSDEVYQQYISNLNKFNSTQWYLYVNQSLNSTDTLVEGNYTYNLFGSDIYSNWENATERLIIIDWTQPTFIDFSNQTFEHYAGVDYDINSSDENSISCFTVNNTNFTINCSGYLRNSTELSNGVYWLNISFNDTANNINSGIMWVNVTDTTPPSFTGIGDNIVEYGDAFAFDINSTDSNNVSCFSVNDTTNFKINCSGYLENNTYLSIDLYNLNISVNDTVGNVNTTIIFVNVVDTTNPTINITYPANNTYTNNTGIYINYTVSDLNLDSCWYSNDSMSDNTTLASCANITSVIWIELTHNITIWVNDTYGNMNSSSLVFTVDTTSPEFINISNRSIFEDDAFGYDINASDTNPLSCFSVNDTTNFKINCSGYLENNTFFGQGLVGLHWLNISVNDSAGNEKSEVIWINISDKGRVAMDLIYPSGDLNVSQHEWFNVSVNVSCSDNDCGNINVSLDPATDRTVRTCSGVWGASCEGADPGLGDYSYDGCSTGSYYSTGFWVDEVYVDATTVAIGDTINITCDFDCYATSSYNDLAISYYNGSWNQIWNQDTSCTDGNYSTTVVVSGDIGVQKARCQIGYYSSNPTGTCFTVTLSDNDDVNFTVIESTKGLVSTVSGTTPFYTNVTNPYNVTLNDGDSQLITWYVNASGTAAEVYEFFVYSNRTNDFTVSNMTMLWNTTIVDTTNPTITDISNYTIEYNYNFSYDINATDFNSISCFTVNDSSFTTSCTGVLGNNSLLSVGVYDLNITTNDTYNNVDSEIMWVNVTATAVPVFTNLVNQTFQYGSIFAYGIVATDLSGIGCYSVNDTSNFNINCSGYLNSTSVLSENIYWLNVTVNDTIGNQNSGVMYVNVTNQDVTIPGVHITYPVNDTLFNYSITTVVLNVSTTENTTCYYSFDAGVINNTMNSQGLINKSNATINVTAGTNYTTNVYCEDLQNNWNRTEWMFFRVDAPVIGINVLYPTGDVNESVGEVFNVTANISCSSLDCGDINVTIDPISSSPFTTNTTHPYNLSLNVNESSIVVFWINSTTGLNTTNEFFVYANNTNAVINVSTRSSAWNVTLLDLTNPRLSFNPSTTSNGSYNLVRNITVNISVYDRYLNQSWINIYNSTGLMNTTNLTYMGFTNLSYGTYYFNASANDTNGNVNNTETRIVVLNKPDLWVSSIYPTGDINVSQDQWFNVTINVTCLNQNCGDVNVTLDPVGSIECGDITNCDFSQAGDCSGEDGTCTNIPGWTYYEVTDGTYEMAQVSTTSNPFGDKGNWLEFKSTYGGSRNSLWKSYIYSETFSAAADYITYSFKGLEYDEWGYGLMIYEEGNETGNFQLLESRCPFTGSWASSDNVWGGCYDNNIYIPAVVIDKTVAINDSLKDKTIRIKVWTGDGGTGDFGEASVDNICLSYENGVCISATKGIIPTTIGNIPFYTNKSSNPYTVNLNASDSSEIVFFVNATGRLNTSYNFFAYANILADMSLRNDTSNWTVTILDLTPPILSFDSPSTAPGYYNLSQIKANISAADSYLVNLTIELYNQTEIINTTTTSASSDYLLFSDLSDGIYYLNATAIDESGNIGYSGTRNITLDNVKPSISIISPIDNFNTSSTSVNFTFSVIENLTSNCTVYKDQEGSVDYLASGSNSSVVSGINTTINSSGFEDRTYLWYLSCRDQAGNQNSSETRTLTVDTTGPNIQINAPTEGGTFGYNVRIQTEITDLLSNVDSAWYFVYNNSDANQELANGSLNSSSSWDSNWDSSGYPGVYWTILLSVYANDSLGNIENRNISFYIDNSQPVIQFINPTGALDYYNSNFSLNVIVQDNSFNYTYYNITKGGSLIQSNTTVFGPDVEHIWGDLIDVTGNEDGIYNLSVYAQDVVSNEITTSTLFILDETNPGLSVHYPVDGSYIDTSSVLFNWTTEDNISESLNCNLTVGSSLTTIGCTNSSSCSYTLGGFSEQFYNFNVTCSDNASNSVLVSSNFTVDSIYPTISFVGSTTQTGNYSADSIFINVSVLEQNQENLTINFYNSNYNIINTSTTSENGLALNITGLSEGTYYFNATVNDSFGHVNNTATREVFIDYTYPQVSLFVNDSNVEYGLEEVSINWTITEDNIKVSLFNVTTASGYIVYNSSTSTGNVNLTSDGLVTTGIYTVSLYVIDIAGNSNTTSITFVVDDTKYPSADITEPSSGNYSRSWIFVNASSDDVSLSQITINLYNGEGLVNSSVGAVSPYTINFTGLVDQIYYLNITACDDSRCNSSETVIVELDTTAPNISFDSSSDSSGNSSNDYIYVKVLASDIRLDTITINLYNSSNESINISSSIVSPLSMNFTNLTDGTYYFNATANDTLSNVNSTSTRVVILNSSYSIDDIDNDGIEDNSDPLLYNESNVTTGGIIDLNITVGGNGTNSVISGEQEVRFYDSNTLLVNFSHNFSNSSLDLSNISIIKSDNYIIINMSGQLQGNKSIYLEDNSFIGLCVKDAEISSVGEISSGCNGANETDFTTCLDGNVTIGGISCLNDGTTFKLGNLRHSAIKGSVASVTSTVTPTVTTRSSSSGGGCVPEWACSEWDECSEGGVKTRRCTRVGTCFRDIGKPAEIRKCVYAAPVKVVEVKEMPSPEYVKSKPMWILLIFAVIITFLVINPKYHEGMLVGSRKIVLILKKNIDKSLKYCKKKLSKK